MHDDLILLQGADAHDRAADAADLKRRRLRAARAEAEAGVEAAGSTLADVDQRIAAHRDHELGLKRALETAQTYRARATKALETGMGDPEAAARQLVNTADQIDALETDQLEAMELSDALTVERAAAATAEARAIKHLEDLLGPFDATISQCSVTIRKEDEQRDALLAQLPKDHQGRYADLRGKNRWAVARVHKEACDACFKVTRQQHVSNIRRGMISPCMGCGRYLVVD